MVEAEAYKTKVVEPIGLISREEREKRIKEASYNTFNLKSDDVYIDLMTDSGTSAMSDSQWAALMKGDESYAGSRNFKHFRKAVKDVLGFKYTIPTHQGRAAENVLFGTLLKEGDIVPFNQPFDTTAAHVRLNNAEPVDCVIDIAKDLKKFHPFKGNVNVEKLESLIRENKEKIPLVMLTLTNNTGGGQPVSMKNIKEVKEVVDKHGIPLWIDAARCSENAYFIKEREEGYQDNSLKEIIKEQFKYADGCTFSAKKDPMVNIGGFIALNDGDTYKKLLPRLINNEGFATYGGLAGRDMECIAQGLHEMTDIGYVSNRIRQTRYLGNKLDDLGIPILKPIGGHAIYVDAGSILPHIPQDQFPAVALSIEQYIESGVRSCGFGAFIFAEEDEETGETIYPKHELTRLAIPRRVYTDRHMDAVADGLKKVYDRREEIKGLKITYEPPVLRHFLARLDRV